MKKVFVLISIGLLYTLSPLAAQDLPYNYQPLLNECITFSKTITSGNTVYSGKNSLRILSDDKIVLRIKHKKKVKNLTFETKLDEESNKIWYAANALTIDMVNKYESDLSKILEDLYKEAEKKSKE